MQKLMYKDVVAYILPLADSLYFSYTDCGFVELRQAFTP